jgi:iron complex outermembrane receptor protein
VTLVEEGQPSEHYVLGGTWFYGDFSANLRFNYFGAVSAEWFTQPVKFTWGGEWLTDLSFSYRMTDDLRVTAGGMNIFDQYPDEWAVGPTNPFPLLGFKYGWETVPFGINGGYYFLRLGYTFDH